MHIDNNISNKFKYSNKIVKTLCPQSIKAAFLVLEQQIMQFFEFSFSFNNLSYSSFGLLKP